MRRYGWNVVFFLLFVLAFVGLQVQARAYRTIIQGYRNTIEHQTKEYRKLFADQRVSCRSFLDRCNADFNSLEAQFDSVINVCRSDQKSYHNLLLQCEERTTHAMYAYVNSNGDRVSCVSCFDR